MDRDEMSDESIREDESFLARWSRRKHRAEDEPVEANTPVVTDTAHPSADDPTSAPTDEDMPPIESLGDDDDYSGFLSPGVSEALRRRALKRLFLSSKFNVTDGLDDYAEDFTQFAPLGDVVTADMRHRMEQMLARLDDGAEEAEPQCTVDSEPPGPATRDASIAEDSVAATGDEPIDDSEEPSPT